jgi:hypothetical protein
MTYQSAAYNRQLTSPDKGLQELLDQRTFCYNNNLDYKDVTQQINAYKHKMRRDKINKLKEERKDYMAY